MPKKKDLEKITDVLEYCNYLYDKFSTDIFDITLDQAKVRGILTTELKDHFKDLKLIEQFISKSNKIIYYDYGILKLPEELFEDYKYLIHELEENNYVEFIKDLILYFRSNCRNNYIYENALIKRRSENDNINMLMNTITRVIDTFTSLPQYDRIVNNKDECRYCKTIEIHSNDVEIYFDFSCTEYRISKIRDDNETLSVIFDEEVKYKRSSNIFYEWALDILKLFPFIKIYYLLKLKVITSFINKAKRYIYLN